MTEGEWRELRLYNSGAGPFDLCKVAVTRAEVRGQEYLDIQLQGVPASYRIQGVEYSRQGVSVKFYVILW